MKERFKIKSASDGLDISVIAVWPKEEPKAVLQIAHGMYGNKERFVPFMEYMAANGVMCVANDHRGHGASVRSAADLGYMYDGGWQALVDDMRQVSEWALEACPGCRLYLLGHSMGSMAARVFAKKHDDVLSGLILCGSPGNNPFAGFVWGMTGMIEKMGGGRFRPVAIQNLTSAFYNRQFSGEGPRAWTCSDPEVRAANAVRYDFTVNGQHALLGLMRETYSVKGWEMTNRDMPVFFISGEDDPCMGSEQSFHRGAMLMHSLGYTNVTSAIYPAMRHEVLNEIGKEQVWEDVLKFVL